MLLQRISRIGLCHYYIDIVKNEVGSGRCQQSLRSLTPLTVDAANNGNGRRISKKDRNTLEKVAV